MTVVLKASFEDITDYCRAKQNIGSYSVLKKSSVKTLFYIKPK